MVGTANVQGLSPAPDFEPHLNPEMKLAQEMQRRAVEHEQCTETITKIVVHSLKKHKATVKNWNEVISRVSEIVEGHVLQTSFNQIDIPHYDGIDVD